MTFAIVATPVGFLRLAEREGALAEVRWHRGPARRPATPLLRAAARWVADYFAGRPPGSAPFPLATAGTRFQRRAWAAIARIPAGRTASYGDLARALDTSPRAVGGACRANPLPLVVPCHRVVATDGGLGGFSGGAGLATKDALLRHERAFVRPPTVPRRDG